MHFCGAPNLHNAQTSQVLLTNKGRDDGRRGRPAGLEVSLGAFSLSGSEDPDARVTRVRGLHHEL